MDKAKEAIYYERKLSSYEQMVNSYWEVVRLIMDKTINSSKYFEILKGTLPAMLYYNNEIGIKKEALERLLLEVAEAKDPEIKGLYNKTNKVFNELIVAMRKDIEGEKDDSSISEAADR